MSEITEADGTVSTSIEAGARRESSGSIESVSRGRLESRQTYENQCIQRLKSEQYEEALKDADRAMESLRKLDSSASSEDIARLHILKSTCLIAMGRNLEAIRTLRGSVRETVQVEGDDVHLLHLPAFCCAIGNLSKSWMADFFTEKVRQAEKPALFSSRDGRTLKIVPSEIRLNEERLHSLIHITLEGILSEARSFLLESWGCNKRLGKHVLAMFRSYAYLHASLPDQALKDANVALAYAPADGQWARGHAVLGSALAATSQWQSSALHMKHALEIEPESVEYASSFEIAARKLSIPEQRVLEEGGTKAYVQWLAEEKERNLPEYLKKRPKYYYYYEWMKKRISEFYPVLPDPVLDKLLDLDAVELDMLLQYPEAIRGQVTEFLEVYETKGAEYLATYRTPQLSWDEVKALQGAAALGLEGGVNSETLALTSIPEDTNHALLGAGGRGELTESERFGLPVRPQLPPDAARDRLALETSLQDRLKLLEKRAFNSDLDAMD